MKLVSRLTSDQVREYTKESGRVGINEYKWSNNILFTGGAVTCFVPIVCSFSSGELGLGHFYSSSPTTILGVNSIKRKPLLSYVEEVSKKVREGMRFRVYLFGGTALNIDYLKKTRDITIKMFEDIGVESVDLTPPEPRKALEFIVADIENRTIGYQYEPYEFRD